MVDVLGMARLITERLGLALPNDLLPKPEGVTIVESVEKNLMSAAGLLRWSARQEPQRIIEGISTLLRDLRESSLLHFSDPLNLVCALFAWHGCLSMAKVLRPTFVFGDMTIAYTLDLRERDYRKLQQEWLGEEAKGNRWVRYGVSLTRLFRSHELRVDQWVPQDSPYWKALG